MLILTKEKLEQLAELSAMGLDELRDIHQLYIRYFGLNSDEAELIHLEIRRRKRLRPELKLAIECLRRQVRNLSKEFSRISALTFKNNGTLYSQATLKPLAEEDRHESVLTGKMAYRVAIDRLTDLDAEIKRLEGYTWSMQQYGIVPHAVMDILEDYGIKPELYRLELASRLKVLKGRTVPGTCKTIKPHKYSLIPLPADGGPKIGALLVCKRCKNFRAGKYKVVYGGVGYNRYYLRKMLGLFKPEPGFRLFVAKYLGGYGHYIISVPESQCFEKALTQYENNADGKRPTYYDRVRKGLRWRDVRLDSQP